MRGRLIVTLALAVTLLIGWLAPAAAQEQGIVIQNNGVDSAHSAAGASNVRVSNNPGAGQANNAPGGGNEVRRANREERNRERKNRGGGGGGEAAPVEAAPVEAPAEGDLQAYSGDAGYTEPVAAPEQMAAPAAPTEVVVNQLPSTGAGIGQTLPLGSLLTGLAAVGFGVAGIRRRFTP